MDSSVDQPEYISQLKQMQTVAQLNTAAGYAQTITGGNIGVGGLGQAQQPGMQIPVQSYPYASPAPLDVPTWAQFSRIQQLLLEAQQTIIELQKKVNALENIKEWINKPREDE